jgi:hypothetical protein
LDISEEDQLSPELEIKHVGNLEALVAGDVKSVGPEQAESLIAIRKEFLRREQTILMTNKSTRALEGEYDALQVECDELTDSIVLQIKYNKQLNTQFDALKHEITRGGVTDLNSFFKKGVSTQLGGTEARNPFAQDKIDALRSKIGSEKFEAIDKEQDIEGEDNPYAQRRDTGTSADNLAHEMRQVSGLSQPSQAFNHIGHRDTL